VARRTRKRKVEDEEVAEPEVELEEEMEKMPPKKRTRDAVETLE
jgi:hypothetical protein